MKPATTTIIWIFFFFSPRPKSGGATIPEGGGVLAE